MSIGHSEMIEDRMSHMNAIQKNTNEMPMSISQTPMSVSQAPISSIGQIPMPQLSQLDLRRGLSSDVPIKTSEGNSRFDPNNITSSRTIQPRQLISAKHSTIWIFQTLSFNDLCCILVHSNSVSAVIPRQSPQQSEVNVDRNTRISFSNVRSRNLVQAW